MTFPVCCEDHEISHRTIAQELKGTFIFLAVPSEAKKIRGIKDSIVVYLVTRKVWDKKPKGFSWKNRFKKSSDRIFTFITKSPQKREHKGKKHSTTL